MGELHFRSQNNRPFYLKELMYYGAYEDAINNAWEDAEFEERPLAVEGIVDELRHMGCEKATSIKSEYERGYYDSNTRDMLNSLTDREQKDLVGVVLADQVSEYFSKSPATADAVVDNF